MNLYTVIKFYLYYLCVEAHSVISPQYSPNLPNISCVFLMSVSITLTVIHAVTCKLNVLSENLCEV